MPLVLPRLIAAGHDVERTAIGIRAGKLLVITDDDAARYRLIAIDLTTGESSDIVPEHDEDVLLDAGLTASGLVLTYSHDASHRMQLASDDGVLGDALPLGQGISVTASDATTETDIVFVTTTSFTDPGTRHRFTVSGNRVTGSEALPRTASAPRTATRIIRAKSAGGTLVVPHLRGGGEYGAEWHRQGTKERKQNVFDDLFAVAEHLFADQLAFAAHDTGLTLA